MPRDLPGMYWDAERNRYFRSPAASSSSHVRPPTPQWTQPQPFINAASSSSEHTTPTRVLEPNPRTAALTAPRVLQPNPHRTAPPQYDTMEVDEYGSFRNVRPPQRHLKPHVSMWDPISRLRSSTRYTDISRVQHDLLCSSIASTSHSAALEVDSRTYNALSSFAVRELSNGGYSALIGDQTGWLFSYSTKWPRHCITEMFMGTDVLSVCLSDEFRIAVPFGPQCEFAIQRFLPREDVDVWSVSRVMNKSCYDVRAAHLEGNSLLLGAASRGILCNDIGNISGTNLQFLNTGSDVLSVHQRDRFAYTGCRNGSIFCFDKRLNAKQSKGQELFAGRFAGSSITHLSTLREWELLISTIRGDLEIHDLRFGRKTTPVMKMQGHLNSYRQKLGLTVSPCQSLVFAAGSDHRIRAWSLRTGEPIVAPTTPTSQFFSAPLSLRVQPHDTEQHAERPHSDLFQDPFPGDIMELQITSGAVFGGEMVVEDKNDMEKREREKERNQDMCLWIASGTTMYRYWLGRQALLA